MRGRVVGWFLKRLLLATVIGICAIYLLKTQTNFNDALINLAVFSLALLLMILGISLLVYAKRNHKRIFLDLGQKIRRQKLRETRGLYVT